MRFASNLAGSSGAGASVHSPEPDRRAGATLELGKVPRTLGHGVDMLSLDDIGDAGKTKRCRFPRSWYARCVGDAVQESEAHGGRTNRREGRQGSDEPADAQRLTRAEPGRS